MKRYGNLYEQICSIENLTAADRHASRGKSYQKGVQDHLKNREDNILRLHEMLINKMFVTSEYKTFTIFEPKRREIYRLPYYPDRVVHHAIMNVLEPIWVPIFTADTYSCIKGRGVHSAGEKIKQTLRSNISETEYCLKIDVKKFYPSVDHAILKKIIRLKIKDMDLLTLLDSVIDSAEGLPIGNYLSQFLANLYMTYFDHWIKEQLKVKYYFRYCDDMVILSGSKEYLHQVLADIRLYLDMELHLTVKENYQIFPVEKRGIDFLGYVYRHEHTRLRKSIKQNFARAVSKRKGRSVIAAYEGWAKHADCKNLIKKLKLPSHETSQIIQRPKYSD